MSGLLVRGLNWLGDAVMSLPALAALSQAEPAGLAVVTGSATREVYRLAPGVRTVLVDDKKLASRLKLIKALKDLRPR
ncbi:MAG: hypothetical protein LBR11_10750, partial [Deltaproteobacteria bacterium]|nr:hypothetical protein [Deltaproteobacteria bacterium]